MSTGSQKIPRPSKAFTQIVNRMAEQFRQLDQVLPREHLMSEEWPNDHRRQIIDEHVMTLYALEQRLRRVEGFWLREGSPLIAGVPRDTLTRYTAYVESRRADIPILFSKWIDNDIVLDLDDAEVDETHGDTSETNAVVPPNDNAPAALYAVDTRSHQDFFQSMLIDALAEFKDSVQTNPDSAYYIDDIEELDELVHSSWFTLDQWRITANQLRPAVFARRASPLNIPPRTQLYDLYKTAVTGNYTATIALARAVTEGVLLERQHRWLPKHLHVDANSGRQGRGRFNALLDAYEDAGVDLPFNEIRATIQEPGNAILHSDDYAKWREDADDLAIDAVNLIARVLTYLHTPQAT